MIKKVTRKTPHFHLYIVLNILCLLFAGTQSMAVSPPTNLQKYKQIITTEWKTYSISATEQISLYGAKHRKFIDTHLYWGEAGYGALGGKRSGYLEGGIFVGYLTPIAYPFLVDFRLFAGAGGGGSAPQGGGLIVNPTVGIGTWLTPSIIAAFEIGYIKFLNGDIESATVAVNINMLMWDLQFNQEDKTQS